MSVEERSSASERTKEQQVRYEDILKQETERVRHRAPPPSSKVVSIKDLKRFQEKSEKDLVNWPTPATSATERGEPDDGADSELGKHEAVARRAERKALMQELNERHAVIENYGGKCVIACWEPSPTDPSRPMLVFQSVDAFRQRYSNRFVKPLRANQRSKVLGAFWLSDPGRRQYRGVTFEPAGPLVVNDYLNTWKGWGVEPKAGRLVGPPTASQGGDRQ
jgi:hypothetical protein